MIGVLSQQNGRRRPEEGRRCRRGAAKLWMARGMTATAMLVASCTSMRANEAEDRGRALLTEFCARCHAVGRTGASPLRTAPPFRTLRRRMDMNELMDRMQEGLFSTHGDMPTFRLRREDARDVRLYLHSIQE
jgi:mono/diheme cytochrome c family protein